LRFKNLVPFGTLIKRKQNVVRLPRVEAEFVRPVKFELQVNSLVARVEVPETEFCDFDGNRFKPVVLKALNLESEELVELILNRVHVYFMSEFHLGSSNQISGVHLDEQKLFGLLLVQGIARKNNSSPLYADSWYRHFLRLGILFFANFV